jgi:hypothetical protein
MEPKKDKIGFLLSGITTEQFATLPDNYATGLPVQLSFGIKFGKKEQDRIIGVFVYFQFEQEHKPFLLIEGGCHFQIEPESWKSITFGSKTTLPKAFATHLVTLAIGTVRGILHAKTENSQFHSFLIPPTDVTKHILEDVVVMEG